MFHSLHYLIKCLWSDGKIIFSSQNLMIKIMYNIYQLTTRKFNKVKETKQSNNYEYIF